MAILNALSKCHSSLTPISAVGELRLRLFSMISTFDTAQDITADELRVESFFPADDNSAAMLKALAAPE